MRIYLIGFMGCGKSSMGHKLARAMGYPFVDLDDEIERLSGLPVVDIFRLQGEPVFRQREQEALQGVSSMDEGVIATGGGTPCFFDNMELMNRTGVTVYIKMPAGALLKRLENPKRERPLLRGKTEAGLLEEIKTLLAAREPLYNQARFTVDGHDPDPERIMRLLA